MRQELADLVADLRAWAAWEGQRGAIVLPAQPPLPADQRLPPMGARRAPSPQAPARPAPARRPPPPAAPPPRRQPAPPPPQHAPGPGPARGQQRSLGLWQSYAAAPAAPSLDQDHEALAKASSLDAVRQVLGDCQRCGLWRGRRQIVFGGGAPDARLVVIGEGPGAQEDQQGVPFVGPAGQMLDRMLLHVLGLSRDDVYICNVVKCRPPRNRNPEPAEIERCDVFLQAQLAAIRPEFALVVGSVAARSVFQTTRGITHLRGQWRALRYPGGEARAMATFHPAYLLRKPQDKRLSFDDLKALKAAMDAAS